MRALIQRVTHASVKVEDKIVGSIEKGFLVLVGVGQEDGPEQAVSLAKKTASLRIFEDENDKMNLSLKAVNGSVLAVSQFTLYADTRHGNRPSFTDAAPPDTATELYEMYCDQLLREGIENVQKGVFGAHMVIELENDGPVTILLEK